jgi:hypothetical protein
MRQSEEGKNAGVKAYTSTPNPEDAAILDFDALERERRDSNPRPPA